jgi:hypothetical protein
VTAKRLASPEGSALTFAFVGALYSYGLRRFLRLPSPPEAGAMLKHCIAFAKLGMTREFIEPVGDRVLRFTWSEEGGVGVTTVTGDLAAEVRRLVEAGGGSAPFDWTADEWYGLFVPRFAGKLDDGHFYPTVTLREVGLEAQAVGPIDDVIADLARWLREVDLMEPAERNEIDDARVEFARSTLEFFRAAERLKVVSGFLV